MSKTNSEICFETCHDYACVRAGHCTGAGRVEDRQAMSKITLEDVAVDLDSDVAAGFDLEQRQACAALVRAAAKVVEAVKDLPSDEIVFEGSRCFVVPLEILEAIDAALAAFDKAGEKP